MSPVIACLFLLLVVQAVRPGDKGELSMRRRSILGAQYQIIVNGTSLTELDYMMPMRDGIHLATDIYRFNDSNSYPVMLARTPYNKSDVEAGLTRVDPADPGYPVKTSADAGAYWNMRGYILIEQDVRGRYNSEGVFTKYRSEALDGFDTVAWILNQTWCNGKIGMFGSSYVAHTQTAALNKNAGLTTIVTSIGGFSDSYQGGIRQGGAFEGKQCTWAYNQAVEGEASNPAVLAQLLNVTLIDWFDADSMPWRHGYSPISAAPSYEDYVIDDWSNGTFSAYWTDAGVYSKGYYTTSPKIPISIDSGWYDVYSRTAVQNFVGFTKAGKKTNLLLGPWSHTTARGVNTGNVTFGSAANYTYTYGVTYTQWLQRWFDRYLKNVSTAVDNYPPVRIFIMGNGTGTVDANGRVQHGGYWRDERTWPLPDTHYVQYFFQADGSLSTNPQINMTKREYDYSPWNPVPTIGGAVTSGDPFMWSGPFQQSTYKTFFPFPTGNWQRLKDRPDVLSWQTDVLNTTLEVTGEIEVHLWVSSNCTDTDFTAKIVDVYPDGTYNLGSSKWPMGNWTYFDMLIQDGILRTRYRDGRWSCPKLMEPGKVYPIVIKLFPTSNTFAVGHRLRIDISSSNFPKYDLNPNTGEPDGSSRNVTVAHNTVWLGGLRPSYVLLPVIQFPRPTCAIWNPQDPNAPLCPTTGYGLENVATETEKVCSGGSAVTAASALWLSLAILINFLRQ